MSNIRPGCIGDSAEFKRNLAEETQKKIFEQIDQDYVLAEKLLKKAPKELREWLEENSILVRLFQHGKASDNIKCNEEPFGDLEDVEAKLCALVASWGEDVIQITYNTHEAPRVDIIITAVTA